MTEATPRKACRAVTIGGKAPALEKFSDFAHQVRLVAIQFASSGLT